MWTSQSMTFYESFITFLIGFSIVFVCLIALAIFITISSKVVGMITNSIPHEKKEVSKKVAAVQVKSEVEDQKEIENLAVIISAISEEMREPIENFQIVSIKEM